MTYFPENNQHKVQVIPLLQQLNIVKSELDISFPTIFGTIPITSFHFKFRNFLKHFFPFEV